MLDTSSQKDKNMQSEFINYALFLLTVKLEDNLLGSIHLFVCLFVTTSNMWVWVIFEDLFLVLVFYLLRAIFCARNDFL